MSLGLASALMIGMSGSGAAQEYVAVTNVTFDPVAQLCIEGAAAPCVRVTGTLTCASTGLAQLVDIFVVQRDQDAVNNLDLLDFACSTEPRAFSATAETDGCDPIGGDKAGCFRPGRATARAVVFRGPVVAEETIRIRKQ
jgi:hypothetical protein